MQVHRPWVKLMLVTIMLLYAMTEAQVFSDLNGDASVGSNAKVNPRTPTPNARKQPRNSTTTTPAPRSTTSKVPSRTPSKAPRAQTPPTSTESTTPSTTPRPKRRQTPPAQKDENETATIEPKPGTVKTPEDENESPSPSNTTPVPKVADKDAKEVNSTSSTVKPKGDTFSPSSTTRSKLKEKGVNATTETNAASPSTPKSKAPTPITPPEVSETTTKATPPVTPPTETSPSTPPSTPPTKSEPVAESPLAVSSASASTAAGNEKKRAPNAILVGFMIAGAVALVVAVGFFVYTKSKSDANEDEHDDMDPDLLSANHDGRRPAAQSSTVAATYHQDMSPMQYSDHYTHPHSQLSFHQSRVNNPNFDVLTPHSQIALAHSQMSVPMMAQSRATSGFESFASQSEFYESSIYSLNDSSVSYASSQVSHVRKGNRESSFMNVTNL